MRYFIALIVALSIYGLMFIMTDGLHADWILVILIAFKIIIDEFHRK